uniref:Gamma-soluble NSF attachment protein n=1 Tax=Scophthalmus maximus TaxID=52904 RepID=A0A8D3AMM9_SCOMX
MAAQKINEAHEHMAKAEKCLKTSLTKWKPDFDSAASEYAKAAVCFKNAKQYDQAKDAYLKEAEYHTENKTAIEQAGMMMKVKFVFALRQEQKKMPEAIQYIEKACMMYMENGTPDTAAMALDRAGKLIEPLNLEKAVDLYQKAAGVYENEDRLRQAVELLGKASRLLVRLRRLDDAAVAMQKEKNMYKEIENFPMCFKKTTAQVLIHLHRGDFVAADKCVRESYSLPGYSGSEDCIAMETLLQGYDEQDEDQVYRVCNSPLLKYMDNDYAKLAISLRVPGGGGKKKKAPAAPQGGASGAPAAAEEEDDYEGGLC